MEAWHDLLCSWAAVPLACRGRWEVWAGDSKTLSSGPNTDSLCLKSWCFHLPLQKTKQAVFSISLVLSMVLGEQVGPHYTARVHGWRSGGWEWEPSISWRGCGPAAIVWGTPASKIPATEQIEQQIKNTLKSLLYPSGLQVEARNGRWQSNYKGDPQCHCKNNNTQKPSFFSRYLTWKERHTTLLVSSWWSLTCSCHRQPVHWSVDGFVLCWGGRWHPACKRHPSRDHKPCLCPWKFPRLR